MRFRQPLRGRTGLFVCCVMLVATMSYAQASTPRISPDASSVICSFERIATATLDSGKVVTDHDTDSGDLVISNLRTEHPLGSGNLGNETLTVLHRTRDMVTLTDVAKGGGFVTPGGSLITLFYATGVVMLTNHEILHTLTGGEAPFGFVEIGKCRPLK